MKLVFGQVPEPERKRRKRSPAISIERREQMQIGKMHAVYGVTAGKTCKECDYFTHRTPGNNTYRKCRIFGISGGPATDWKARYEACGKFVART